jgi:flagellar transcriptional activator FlhC
MILNTLNRHALAIELLSLKARISIVAKETGLSPAILRKAFVVMHQRSPSCGSMKTSPQFISKSFSLLKESTLYVFYFRIESDTDFCRRSINAYRQYSTYIKTVSNTEPLLDFSDAWVISKWSDTGILKLVRCNHCRSAKLVNNDLQQNVCCVCKC